VSDLQTLAEQLKLDTTTLPSVRKCANGCGTTLAPEQAKSSYALCERCTRITSTGYRGCLDCGREWTAGREAHCADCHRQFSSDSAFDLHWGIDHGPCAARPENQGSNSHKVCYAAAVHRDPAAIRKGDGTPRLVEIQTDHGPVWSWPGGRPSAINRSTS
jgi:hypothetical protein